MLASWRSSAALVGRHRLGDVDRSGGWRCLGAGVVALAGVAVDVLLAGELADLEHHLVGHRPQRPVPLRHRGVPLRGDRAADRDRARAGRAWAPWRRAAGSCRCRRCRPGRSARRPRARAGRRRCGPCATGRPGCACLPGRSRTARRGGARRRPLRGRAAALEPPERSIGIIPSTGNRNFVFHDCMYSALPTKLMLRGTESIRNAESRNEMWFGHRIAGPSAGSRSKPLSSMSQQPAGERRQDSAGRAAGHRRRRLP